MDRSDSVTVATDAVRDSPRDHNSRRAAACLVCRRSKIKCEKGRAQNDDRCHRCLQLGVQCVRPDFHVGRRKGVKKSAAHLFCLMNTAANACTANAQGWRRRCIRWSRP